MVSDETAGVSQTQRQQLRGVETEATKERWRGRQTLRPLSLQVPAKSPRFPEASRIFRKVG